MLLCVDPKGGEVPLLLVEDGFPKLDGELPLLLVGVVVPKGDALLFGGGCPGIPKLDVLPLSPSFFCCGFPNAELAELVCVWVLPNVGLPSGEGGLLLVEADPPKGDLLSLFPF